MVHVMLNCIPSAYVNNSPPNQQPNKRKGVVYVVI